jgi:hypothetical protein
MLEGVYSRHLAAPTLHGHSPAPARFSPSSHASGEFGHRTVLELSSSATRRSFSAVDGIAKHFRHGGGATEEMNLKTVGLFLCAHLGVDAADICFRLRIRPAAHNDQNKLKRARINELCVIYLIAIKSGVGRPHERHFSLYAAAGRSA